MVAIYKVHELRLTRRRAGQVPRYNHSLLCLDLTTSAESDTARQEEIMKRRDLHFAFVDRCKEHYYSKRQEGRTVRAGSGLVSMIMDGMDQAKTDLPHFRLNTRCVHVTVRFGSITCSVLII